MKQLIRGLALFFLLLEMAFARVPLLLFTPQTATQFNLGFSQIITVKYVVQNLSKKSHTLVMQPIQGITQVTTPGFCSSHFTLGYNQSCILNLTINTDQLRSSIKGGPVVCQQQADGSPSPLLCYQPAAAAILQITIPQKPQYTLFASAGPNGSVQPHGTLKVLRGESLTFTATPNLGYLVYQWIVDGKIAQMGGGKFTLGNIVSNHTVQVTFTNGNVFYGIGQNGKVYFSFTQGATWTTTPAIPAPGVALTSLFATASLLYVGAANGYIYYSFNNGTYWYRTSSPDGSAVSALYVKNNVLYAGTASGGFYISHNKGLNWVKRPSPDGSGVNALMANPPLYYAGTNNGYVYVSKNNGFSWLTINSAPDGSPVKSLFMSNNTLYVGTGNEFVYSSPNLLGGGAWTWIAQTVYSLFVEAATNTLYAGTQSGFVFSVSDGEQLGFVDYTLLNAIFVLS